MKKPPAWLFVNLADAFGGHEVMMLRWMQELEKQKLARVVLLCIKGTRLASLAREFCVVKEVELPPIQKSRPQRARALATVVFALATLRLRYRPALAVIAEGCLMAQEHSLNGARKVGLKTLLYVPLTASFAEMGFSDAVEMDQETRQRYAKWPDKWVVLTEGQAKELREWTHCQQPILVLPNTVAQRIADRPLRDQAAPHAPAQPCKVLILGRIDFFQKGIDQVLQHLSQHPEDAGGCRISIIGEGRDTPKVNEALAKHPHLKDIITVRPWADSEEAIAEHDVLLLPSRFEGVPLVMLEAMAMQRPVIATRLPGTQPYLMDEALSEVGDMSALFANLRAVASNPERYQAQAQANRRMFEQHASPAAFAQAVLKISKQLA